MPKKRLLEEIVQAPGRYYRVPVDVIRDRRFSDTERLAILEAWEKEMRAGSADPAQLESIGAAREEVVRRTTKGDQNV
ncbi:MAG: hypothetical protein JSR60_18110 [Proteobacteria bacterium]|nr:hypothetical protein [Pseudomonadota bacterium]